MEGKSAAAFNDILGTILIRRFENNTFKYCLMSLESLASAVPKKRRLCGAVNQSSIAS